jgi:diketogulonate reductase-like aldo/keto reductase
VNKPPAALARRIPVYLFADTVAGFAALQEAGKIRHWGVSNLDADDMAELLSVPGGAACATDQVLYNLVRRGPEWDLMPYLAQHHIPVMAYSPVEQGRLPRSGALADVARRHGVTPFQVALAFVLRRPDVIAIPKAATPAHVRENVAALDLVLDADDLAALDRAFPPPEGPRPLEML